MSKITPGTWEQYGGYGGIEIKAADGQLGVDVALVRDSAPEMRGNATAVAAVPELLAALQRADRLMKEALPKFNWGASFLDANAIRLLNEVPGEIRDALAKAGYT